MARRRMAFISGVLALAVALVPASAAQGRVPKVFFGIAAGGFTALPDYQQMHRIKVRTMRIGINWRRVEPTRGHFDWSDVDTRVTALAENGISPAMFVFSAPQWATGATNPSVPPVKGTALSTWKGFLKKAVNRYKKGGYFWRAHPKLPVKAANSWQIWNEPNLPKYFSKPGTYPIKPFPHAPRAYAKLVKASDKAVHRADKHAKVILAGLSGNPDRGPSADRFIKRFLKARRITRHFDAAAIHPYTPKVQNYRVRLSKFRKALNRGGAKKKPIWLTEVGWGSANDAHPMNKGLTGQAKILTKSFKTTLKHRKRWKIGRLYWFTWRDPKPHARASCTFCPSAGLLRYDRTPKPAFDRFKRFAKKQGGGRHRHHHHRA